MEVGKYMRYLPGAWQKTGSASDTGDFLGRFLLAFEQLLSGIPGTEGEGPEGIEALLDRFDKYLDPYYAPAKFLPWLAECVALKLREGEGWYGHEDMEERDKAPEQLLPLGIKRESPNRRLIGRIVCLYKKRGTKEGLEEYIRIYTGDRVNVAVNEFAELFRGGVTPTVGENTAFQICPYHFEVVITPPTPDRSLVESIKQGVKEIIDREKPFYTHYGLFADFPFMQVGVYSRVGCDTLMGGIVGL